MFLRLGRLVFRHRRWVVALWVSAVLASLPLAPRVADHLKTGGFTGENLESARVARELELFDQPADSLVAIFQADAQSGPAFDDPHYRETLSAALEVLRTSSFVDDVLSPIENRRQVAPDGRTSFAVIRVTPAVDSRSMVQDIQRRLREVVTPNTGIEVLISGASVFYADIEDASERDLRRAELAAFPLGLLALLIVLGSLVAAAVPVVVGGIAVAIAMAAIFLLGQQVDLSIFVLNVATMLGLGLSIDYALFITARYREELREHSVEEAVGRAVTKAGRAIFFSALTVFSGLLGLLTFDTMMLRSVGIAGLLVVSIAAVAALTLLPALLAIIGKRINALPIPTPRWGGFSWANLAEVVMSHPLPIALAVLAVLLALGTPFLRIRLSAPDASILPVGTPSREGYRVLREAFGEAILVVVQATGDIVERANIGALYDLTHRIEADDRVERVDSIVTLDARLTRDLYGLMYSSQPPIDPFAQEAQAALVRGDKTLVGVASRHPMSSDETQGLVRDIRELRSDGLRIIVGGGAAAIVDYVENLYSGVPRALLIIVLATYLTLLALFRSVVLPLKAIVMNTLSILASYGALVAIFQEGYLGNLLGVTPAQFVEASLPIVMFCFLFGVSMDYEVFLLSRVKEAYDRSGNNALSVAEGLQVSGRIITSAALIVVVVSASFITADIVLIKALGLGTAIAVLLDATVVRALLVPATMRLLGNMNWWLPDARSFWRLVSPRRGGRGIMLPSARTLLTHLAIAVLALVVLVAASRSWQLRPHESPATGTTMLGTTQPSAQAMLPIVFPRDEGVHDNLTEWWYYTGHLEGPRRFGFQLVIFQSRRAQAPIGRAAHFAITDLERRSFYYDQRALALDHAPPAQPLDLRVGGWRIARLEGRDYLEAVSGPYALQLELRDSKPPALHNVDGVVSFGPAGDSYYYSRTNLVARGALSIAGQTVPVKGSAWMDHQWGNFLVLNQGGWDWFGLQLEDGSELALSQVRDAGGNVALRYGLYVGADGDALHIPSGELDLAATSYWTSPHSGARYPARWKIAIPGQKLALLASAAIDDQELDARVTTGRFYWEGSVTVEGTTAGRPVTGRGYVELTGYAR